MWIPVAPYVLDRRRLTRDQFVVAHPEAVLVNVRSTGVTGSGGKREYHTESIGRRDDISTLPEVEGWALHTIKKGTRSAFNTHISVGRTSATDIQIDHPSVSKFHAYFIVDATTSSHNVGDGSSKNGTFVNGVLLPKRDPVPLGDDATLRFGEVEIRYLMPPALFRFLGEFQWRLASIPSP
ncbi:MAG: hypothetical protein NVS3B20_01290 [Polyangiales bacterium]